MEQSKVGLKFSSQRKGGLFRYFLWPQLLLILVTGVGAFFWLEYDFRREKREAFVERVQAHAELTRRIHLPVGASLAGYLSDLSGFKMAFTSEEGALVAAEAWSEEEQEAAWQGLALESGQVLVISDYEVVVASLEGSHSLVAIRPETPLFDFKNQSQILWPIGVGVMLALSSAFAIAQLVVRPLEQLAQASRSVPAEEELTLPDSLLKRKDEIGELAASLRQERGIALKEQGKRQEAEKMALLGKMATSLAHEIKNPASAILMHAQNLPCESSSEVGSLIQEEAEEIVSLVNQWLYVARPEPPVLKLVDLERLVRRLGEKMSAQLSFHRCRLDIQAKGLLEIHGDSRRLEMVFRNLIVNAIQAMPEGGIVSVELLKTESEGEVAFWVRDEGGGFSAEALNHFGVTFYSEKEGGMGLGLALVKTVVQAHGGRVEARNQGGGVGAEIYGSLTVSQIMES